MARFKYGSNEKLSVKSEKRLLTELKVAFNFECETTTKVVKEDDYYYNTRKWGLSRLDGAKAGLISYSYIKDRWSSVYRDFDNWATRQIARLEVRWSNKFIEVG